MKRLALAALLSPLAFVACSSVDEPAGPTITVFPGDEGASGDGGEGGSSSGSAGKAGSGASAGKAQAGSGGSGEGGSSGKGAGGSGAPGSGGFPSGGGGKAGGGGASGASSGQGGTGGSSGQGGAGGSAQAGAGQGGSGPPPPPCPNGACDNGETCESCPQDCGACPPPPPCPNGACDNGETCESCPQDCGACPPPPPSCPALSFPSGVHIQTFEDAAMTALYDSISDDGCFPKPTCWIDVDNLQDPVAGVTYDTSVKLSPHFALSELVGTELPYSHKVLVAPSLVEHLELYRANAGGNPVNLTSGFRSPQHQKAVCQSVCGQDCCPNDPNNPCACRSRHEWGDAADIASSNPSSLYTAAGQSGFGYCLSETGHLHVDMSPCGAGCPPLMAASPSLQPGLFTAALVLAASPSLQPGLFTAARLTPDLSSSRFTDRPGMRSGLGA